METISDPNISTPTASKFVFQEETPVTIGLVGWWRGPLKDEMIGIVLDETILELYESTRCGFVLAIFRKSYRMATSGRNIGISL